MGASRTSPQGSPRAGRARPRSRSIPELERRRRRPTPSRPAARGPEIAAGSTIETSQARMSFVRLISASRLPAIARSDFCFGLEASSSASPSRGSRISPSRCGSRRASSDAALEGETSGARMGSDEDFSTASAHSMRRFRSVAKPGILRVQAAQSRRRLLGRVADTGTFVLPVHFPNPATGLVSADGDRFRYTFGR